jgi:hypothetical protein
VASDDLERARESLDGDRPDEALVHLWNALEPARLAGGRELQAVERLATRIAGGDDEAAAADATRLLETIRRDADTAEPAAAPVAVVAGEGFAPTQTEEPDEQQRRPPGLRRLLPLLVLGGIVLANVLSRVLGHG